MGFFFSSERFVITKTPCVPSDVIFMKSIFQKNSITQRYKNLCPILHWCYPQQHFILTNLVQLLEILANREQSHIIFSLDSTKFQDRLE